MCVTLGQAEITDTEVYGYVAPRVNGVVRHVVGYQNKAKNLTNAPNCMFLNYPGTDLQLVQPATHTRNLMSEITSSLLGVIEIRASRSGGMYGDRSVTIEEYGDYTIVCAQDPHDILAALDQVDEQRRPIDKNGRLERMADHLARFKPNDSILMGCFDGQVKPKHPIVTNYIPNDSTVLAVPGLDGHDGGRPVIGAPVARQFKVAFGVHGMPHGQAVDYGDKDAVSPLWVPERVVGFVDNRPHGPNGDYALPIDAITAQMNWLDEASTLAGKLLDTHL